MPKSKTLHTQRPVATGSFIVNAKRFLFSDALVAVIALVALAAAAVWLFSAPPLEGAVQVEARGELGRAISSGSVALGYALQPLGDMDVQNDGPQLYELAVKRLDENGFAYFDRSLVASAEEKNAEKGTALFQIHYNDGVQDNVVTLKIPEASKKANKIVFNLLPTPIP